MGIQTIVADVRTYVNGRAGYEQTVVDYGRRKVTEQVKQGGGQANRVIFAPAPQGGQYDKMFARSPGQPFGGGADASGPGRPTTTLQFPYEVHCWAYDATGPSDELAQDNAAMKLANVVVVALRSGPKGGHGAMTLGTGKFTQVPVELKFGSEFVFIYVLEVRVEDVTDPSVVPEKFAVAAKMPFPDDTTHEEDFQVPPPA